MLARELLKGARGLTGKIFYDGGNRDCFATGALIGTDREGAFDDFRRVALPLATGSRFLWCLVDET